jgi:predicted PurR-regulated permease PerM
VAWYWIPCNTLVILRYHGKFSIYFKRIIHTQIYCHQVQATAWELLSAMLLMEAAFGIVGLVAAPVMYAWLKAEVKEQGMI